MGKILKNIIILGVVVALVIGALTVKLGNATTDTYKVERIEKVLKTHGNGDGFDTELVYHVHTDKGLFLVELSGLNSYPFALTVLRRGGEYTMKTRGARIEVLGLYPNIIEIVEPYD